MEVQRLASDGNQLWFSSGASIVRYILSERRWEIFGANDGIYTGSFSANAGAVTRDGRIYMGASDGFVSFIPGSVRVNTAPPPVLFTRFTASGPGLVQDIFRAQDRDRIVLPWRMRDVNISFAALSYGAPEKIRFAYRLEGFPNADWQDLGNQNYLSLSQLPAGRYRLQVIAANNSGIWNNEGATLSFTVRPHPLLSGFAVLLYALLAGITFYLLGRWYLRRTEEKTHLKYERQLDEAVSHLKEEERDDRYQLVSSLADQLEAPLAGIGLQLEKMKAAPSRTGLTVLEKNHRMLKGVAASLQQMKNTLRSETETAPEPTLEEDFLARLDRIIHDNIANPDLSVAFLAKEMAISRSGLFAKVKELCGETPNNLINQARLNAAAALLSEGRHTVGEICYMTGFSSPSYFSKSFATQFGVTPHEWAGKTQE
jgi:AraC-like DNA-binding protein